MKLRRCFPRVYTWVTIDVGRNAKEMLDGYTFIFILLNQVPYLRLEIQLRNKV